MLHIVDSRSRISRSTRVTAFGLAAALATAGMFAASLGAPSPAAADPAPDAAPTSFTAPGTYTATVPGGVCSVAVSALGGAGGSATPRADWNGAGARVGATFSVLPDQTIGVTVGAGGVGKSAGAADSGSPGVGGPPGGARGGFTGGSETTPAGHAGAGGGGYSEVSIGSDTLVLAGGGGGSSGGHATAGGRGGSAGLPTGSGAAAGGDGQDGYDYGNDGSTTPVATPDGGQGGQTTGPGAGGAHGLDPALDGGAASGRTGGVGATDPGFDSGGGGGGGWFGGAGAASTTGEGATADPATGNAGGGGGGGASYVAASVNGVASTAISSALGPQLPSTGVGANGTAALAWQMCDYDLGVTTSVSDSTPLTGDIVTWTVTVRNTGAQHMTLDDTVSLLDTLPGAGVKTITAISTSASSDPQLASDPVTCSSAVGATMTSPLTCSRPYRPLSGTASGVRGLNVGETLTIVYTQRITEPAGTTLIATASTTDRPTGDTNDSAPASLTVDPLAVDDQDLGNTVGDTVAVDVIDNDDTAAIPTSVVLVGAPGDGRTLTVPGQGVWTVDPATGAIEFDPETDYSGDPDPVDYRVSTSDGRQDQATVTVTYVPAASDDQDLDNTIGDPVGVDVLANDTDNLLPASVRILGAPGAGTTLTVPGQGTWTVAPATGAITFAPQSGYTGNPSPVDYTADTGRGDTVGARVTVTYLPIAADDASLGNAPGSTVPVDVLANDSDNLVPGSVRIVGAPGDGRTLTVPAEGIWTVDPATGAISFAPAAGFTDNPTPVGYRADDGRGNARTATVTVTYLPQAVDDAELGKDLGDPVVVDVLTNDSDNLVPGSVRIVGAPGDGRTLTVPGEGIWTVDPASGAITFTPAAGFTGDPTPIRYRADDGRGLEASATVTVGYLPEAGDDTDIDNVLGTTVAVDVLGNDSDNLVPGSVRIAGAPGDGRTLTVPGEGIWTVDPATGAITFTPEAGFTGDPGRIRYTAIDSRGNAVGAFVTVAYLPRAADDEDLRNEPGDPVTIDVLANDSDNLVPGSVRIVGAAGDGRALTVPGEGVWTVDPATGGITFTPETTFTGDPTSIDYQAADSRGRPADATVRVAYLPGAVDDEDLGNRIGDTVTVDVLANDSENLVPGTVRIVGAPGDGRILTVAGEGVWTVDPATDRITFAPDAGFEANPAPIEYQVEDPRGDAVTATVTVTYAPVAVADRDLDNVIGSPVTVPVLDNDSGDLDPASVRFIGGSTTLTVAGQGVWSIDPATGAITFTPDAGLRGNPDPVRYQADGNGVTVETTVTVSYVPVAADDVSRGNRPGTAVTVDVLGNDTGNFDLTSLRLVDPASGARVTTLVVPGEGRWIAGSDGRVTFTPQAGFTGDPTPARYEIRNLAGVLSTALIVIDYAAGPTAAGLAITGSQAATGLGVGAVLLALGVLAIRFGRRRTT